MERDVQTLETVSIFKTMLERGHIMFGTRRNQGRSLNALLCQVLWKIV